MTKRKVRTPAALIDGIPFGERGRLTYDAATDRVQCHLCGEWYKQLTTHLWVHELTTSEYRERFGLGSAGLMSPGYRYQDARRTPARYWPPEAVLQELRDLHARLGVPLTPEVVKRAQVAKSLGKRTPGAIPSLPTILRRFGSWDNVRKALPDVPILPANPRGKDPRYMWSAEDMLHALEELEERTGQQFTNVQLTSEGIGSGRTSFRGRYPSPTTLSREFGSLKEVHRLLGHKRRWALQRPDQWTEDEMLDALRALEDRIGRPFSAWDLRRLPGRGGSPGRRGEFPSHGTLVRHFGSTKRVRELLADRRKQPPAHLSTST